MKRENSEEASLGSDDVASTKKPRLVTFEPVRLPVIFTVEELDQKMVAFQNKKLSQRLIQRIRIEEGLEKRVQQLELRQTQDDALLCIINRHWNRLDEDVRILLQRFDAETAVETEAENESKATSSFLAELGHLDKKDVDEKLSRRVEFSRRAIGKLVQAFDRLTQRNERIGHLLSEVRGGDDAEGIRPESEQPVSAEQLNHGVASMNVELQEENKRLHDMVTELHQQNHSLALRQAEADDQLSARQTRIEELSSQVEDLKYELDRSQAREAKLDYSLAELVKHGHQVKQSSPSADATGDSSNGALKGEDHSNKLDELQQEMEDYREQAANRLLELQRTHENYKEALKENQDLKLKLSHLPEPVILNTVEYKRLQSQYSVLYQQSMAMQQQLEETRTHLIDAKVAHLKQIEQMESEELLAQKQLRSEMIQLEDQLSQVRREYEMLRVEFEQNLAANEQSGPLTKELRTLLASCKAQNQALKSDVGQFKNKWKTACSIIKTLEEDLAIERGQSKKKLAGQDGKTAGTGSGNAGSPATGGAGSEGEPGEIPSPTRSENYVQNFTEQLRDLQRQLDGVSKHADDDEFSPSERRLREDNAKLRIRVLKMEKEGSENELAKRLERFESQCEQQKKQIDSAKSEEEALLNEMEAIGQAFEDMQEQNLRLAQQLREKDDANFKLMSERIRSNQQSKILDEEKDLITEQVVALQNQVEAQNLVVRKLEEKERLLQNTLATIEKELNIRQQVLELHKRKALEATQSGADLKLQVEKLQSQLDEAVAIVAEKTGAIEHETYKYTRLQEDLSILRRKLERAKKMEKASTADEVLFEEIRELKEQLTCPSCKVRRKDGILTKCSHVFCMECLRSRYETRQRKCPKCNCLFGANDFRRIYIT